MSIFKKIFGLCSMALTSTVLANTVATENFPDYWHVVVGASVGPAWTQPGSSQTLYLQPDIQKGYVTNSNNQELTTGEFFLGFQRNLNSYLTGQFGFAVSGIESAKLNGGVLEDANPAFNNFTYTYNVEHTYVAAKARLIACPTSYVQPYVSGSIGVGINRAYNFSMVANIPEEVPAPNFTSNTQSAFSYTVGVGIQKSFSPHWQAGVGYEFADWGKSNLGAAAGQTVNQGLSLNHVYTHQLQFTLIYIT